MVGTVIGWRSREAGAKIAVVQLDSILRTRGTRLSNENTPAEQDVQAEGVFVLLSPRYVGQEWLDDGATVHVELRETDPLSDDQPGTWVASHGVYRVLTEGVS